MTGRSTQGLLGRRNLVCDHETLELQRLGGPKPILLVYPGVLVSVPVLSFLQTWIIFIVFLLVNAAHVHVMPLLLVLFGSFW